MGGGIGGKGRGWCGVNGTKKEEAKRDTKSDLREAGKIKLCMQRLRRRFSPRGAGESHAQCEESQG